MGSLAMMNIMALWPIVMLQQWPATADQMRGI